MVDAPINPEVLRWAREQRSITEEQAAEALGIRPAELQAIERGAASISFAFLQEMADAYEIQEATLLMPEPLPGYVRGRFRDFRIVEGGQPELSLRTNVVLSAIDEALDFFADLHEDAPEILPSANLPLAHMHDDPAEIAAQQRTRLGVTIDEQLGWDNETLAFRMWRAAIEAQGIFVYLIRLRQDREIGRIRGVSFWDERHIPAILINADEERYQPRIFSLIHEYGHLLLRASGISDENRTNAYERWCNQFAAHLLMPFDVFAREIDFDAEARPRYWSDRDLSRVASRFNVSLVAAAIHLEDIGAAPRGFYEQKKEEWRGVDRGPARSFGRATHTEKAVNRLGIRHLDIVFQAYDAGIINEHDVDEVTDVRQPFLTTLRRTLRERQAAYGR